MPTFNFDFNTGAGGERVTLTLKPIDYILKVRLAVRLLSVLHAIILIVLFCQFNIHNRDECVVGISPDKDTIWTLGQVFLRTFYTVFDRDEDRIGFAHLHRTKFNAVNHRLATSLLERSGSAPLRSRSQAFVELNDKLSALSPDEKARVEYDPADDIDNF